MITPTTTHTEAGGASPRSFHRDDSPQNPQLLAMYGVFDGHGGVAASEQAAALLPHLVLSRLRDATSQNRTAFEHTTREFNEHTRIAQTAFSGLTDTREPRFDARSVVVSTIRAAFAKADAEICSRMTPTAVLGTTATVALVVPLSMEGSPSGTSLFVAHIGDSRALLVETASARFLTHDHLPARADEAQRVQHAGGAVLRNRVNGVLAVSRALGDRCLKAAVISEPDIVEVPIRRDSRFLVLGTDGLWDFVTSDDAYQIVDANHAVCDMTRLARMLADKAIENGATDDVSVIVIDLASHANCHRSLIY